MRNNGEVTVSFVEQSMNLWKEFLEIDSTDWQSKLKDIAFLYERDAKASFRRLVTDTCKIRKVDFSHSRHKAVINLPILIGKEKTTVEVALDRIDKFWIVKSFKIKNLTFTDCNPELKFGGIEVERKFSRLRDMLADKTLNVLLGANYLGVDLGLTTKLIGGRDCRYVMEYIVENIQFIDRTGEPSEKYYLTYKRGSESDANWRISSSGTMTDYYANSIPGISAYLALPRGCR